MTDDVHCFRLSTNFLCIGRGTFCMLKQTLFYRLQLKIKNCLKCLTELMFFEYGKNGAPDADSLSSPKPFF